MDILDLIKGHRKAHIPPKRLIYTGSGDIEVLGKTHVDRFIEHKLITPKSKVLDVGSGIGRCAIPLTSFLTDEGSYDGFDIVSTGVRWCEENITPYYPNFRFQHIPLKNDLYRSSGGDASKFHFPFDSGAFDFAFVVSVFTHMMSHEVVHYLEELYRVLKKDGYCYATFFILNKESTRMMRTSGGFDFKFDYGDYAFLNEKVKSANVAFNESYLDGILMDLFHVKKKIYGYWSSAHAKQSNDFQDIYILQKN
jgi:SAM-dependent methyltransferase